MKIYMAIMERETRTHVYLHCGRGLSMAVRVVEKLNRSEYLALVDRFLKCALVNASVSNELEGHSEGSIHMS